MKDIGVVLASVYFLLFGAYNMLYAKSFLATLTLFQCSGEECLRMGFYSLLGWILLGVGICYILLSILIRFHRLGCYGGIVISLFNILLIIAYAIRPALAPLRLVFIFPLTLPFLLLNFPQPESLVELLFALLNAAIAIYLFLSLARGVWDGAQRNAAPELEEDIEEEIENSRA